MNSTIKIKGKSYNLPIYLPDATRAITKSIDSQDLVNAEVRGAVVNTYHLMSIPGMDVLNKTQGVKNFMNFNGLIVSDSGGWQVFSLIKRNNTKGKITDEGIVFSLGGGKNQLFTPEKSIQVQFSIKSDIVICLDDFCDLKASKKDTERVVKRTIEWAKRSKDEYNRLIKKDGLTKDTAPLLFCVIQGGKYKDLRKYCAEELIKIGFDGYGLGGYVIDEATNKMDMEISKYILDLIPQDAYKFALGAGKPEDIVECAKMGWEIFDCTLPTRDARHKRLYVFNSENSLDYNFLYINKKKHSNDMNSIDNNCDCHTCKNYSRAYLHHLFQINDTTAFRLATIHNLRFYTKLIEKISKPI